MNRREVIAGGAVSLVAARSAAAAAAEETPVMALFRAWRVAQAEESAASREAEEIFTALSDKRYEIELRMLATPSRDGRDVVAKIAAWTDFGDFEFAGGDERLKSTWAEIRAMFGGEA